MRTATPGGVTPAAFQARPVPNLYNFGTPEVTLVGDCDSEQIVFRDGGGNSSYHLFLSPANARELAGLLHIAAAAAEARDALKK